MMASRMAVMRVLLVACVFVVSNSFRHDSKTVDVNSTNNASVDVKVEESTDDDSGISSGGATDPTDPLATDNLIMIIIGCAIFIVVLCCCFVVGYYVLQHQQEQEEIMAYHLKRINKFQSDYRMWAREMQKSESKIVGANAEDVKKNVPQVEVDQYRRLYDQWAAEDKKYGHAMYTLHTKLDIRAGMDARRSVSDIENDREDIKEHQMVGVKTQTGWKWGTVTRIGRHHHAELTFNVKLEPEGADPKPPEVLNDLSMKELLVPMFDLGQKVSVNTGAGWESAAIEKAYPDGQFFDVKLEKSGKVLPKIAKAKVSTPAFKPDEDVFVYKGKWVPGKIKSACPNPMNFNVEVSMEDANPRHDAQGDNPRKSAEPRMTETLLLEGLNKKKIRAFKDHLMKLKIPDLIDVCYEAHDVARNAAQGAYKEQQQILAKIDKSHAAIGMPEWQGGGHGDRSGARMAEEVQMLETVAHPLLKGSFEVMPYGVLGNAGGGKGSRDKSAQRGDAIDAVIVDPAGYPFIGQQNRPAGAAAASGAIYSWLGMQKSKFPNDVHQHFKMPSEAAAECRAKFYQYGHGQNVIHVIGPKLEDLCEALVELSDAYTAVLVEFCKAVSGELILNSNPRRDESSSASKKTSGGKNTKTTPGPTPVDSNSSVEAAAVPKTLRLLPISSGIFCRNQDMQPHMAQITWSAVSLALTRLPNAMLEIIQKCQIQMCIFLASEVDTYTKVLNQKKACFEKPKPLLSPSWGSVTQQQGGFDWVRRANAPRDRLERLNTAMLTQQAISAQGYSLADGRVVALQPLEPMLNGTRIVRASEMPNAPQAQQSSSKQPEIDLHLGAPGPGSTVMDLAVLYTREGYKTVAINAASAYHVGGGALSGGRHALEEAWCVTSTLMKSLHRAKFVIASTTSNWFEVRDNYGQRCFFNPESQDKQRKMPAEGLAEQHIPVDGCIVSPAVEVFREPSTLGYRFMEKPCVLSGVVSMAMFNKNAHVSDSPLDAPRDDDIYRQRVRDKFRVAVSAALEVGAEVLVIPDVGCGVFDNDPKTVGHELGMALLEFGGRLKKLAVTGNPKFAEAMQEALLGVHGNALPGQSK